MKSKEIREKVYFNYDNFNMTVFPRTRVYSYVEDESKINHLRNMGYRLNHVPETNEKRYISEIKEESVEEKIKNIETFLALDFKDNKTIEEDIFEYWFDTACHKNQNNKLNDKCSNLLDRMADYFLYGLEGDNILDTKRWEKIKKYEVASFVNEIDDDIEPSEEKNTYEKRKMNSKDKKYFKKHNKAQISRWRNSLTRAMDRIYTYDNTEEIEEWILDTKVKIKPRVPVKYERLINPKEPFIAEWCRVDVDGYFTFNDKCWQVKDKVYKCNPLADKGFVQDKILCYEQYDKYYFFDMNINGLKEVKEVTENG